MTSRRRLRRRAPARARSACDRLPGRQVEEVQGLALVGGEREVALDHQALGDRRVAGEAELGGDLALVHLAAARERRLLAVQREPAAGDGAVLERAPHEARRDDRHGRRR